MNLDQNRSKVWQRGTGFATTVPKSIVLIRHILLESDTKCFWTIPYGFDTNEEIDESVEKITVRFDKEENGKLFEISTTPFIRGENSLATTIPNDVINSHDVKLGDNIEWDINEQTGKIELTFLKGDKQ